MSYKTLNGVAAMFTDGRSLRATAVMPELPFYLTSRWQAAGDEEYRATREAAIDALLRWFDLDKVGYALREMHRDRDREWREARREMVASTGIVPQRWWLR